MRRFCIVLILSILLILSPIIAHALSYDKISQIARETIVLIDGCTSGSGVIYERKDNIYSVLTAKHVVSKASGCFVITPDNIKQKINSNIFIPVSGVDLAVVQFSSNNNYKLANLGNSATLLPGKTVYVAGAPEPSTAIPQRTLLVTPGNIVGIQQPQNGYSLIYNNATRRGMSGGAVLNEEGKVIGIHGQGDEQDGSKVGLNLGIPIKLFLDAPKLIPAPANIKPNTKISPSLSPNKPLPVNPNETIVESSQPQKSKANVKNKQYESLTAEERKKRVETCNNWLGNHSSNEQKNNFGKMNIMRNYIFFLLLIILNISCILHLNKSKTINSHISNFSDKIISHFVSNSFFILLMILFGIILFQIGIIGMPVILIIAILIIWKIETVTKITGNIPSNGGFLLTIGIFIVASYTYYLPANKIIEYIGDTYCRPFGYSHWLG